MLSGDFADDKSDIEVPDIDVETFRTMLRYAAVFHLHVFMYRF